MFGLGMPEILLILAIALIVIGPKRLPELAKTLGRAMGEFKRSAQDLKRSIDLESTVQDVPAPSKNLKKVIKEVNEPDQADDMEDSEEKEPPPAGQDPDLTNEDETADAQDTPPKKNLND